MNIRFAVIALSAFVAGCSLLPPGDAPEGNIVSNRQEFFSEAEVSEHLATRLSLFLLENYPASPFSFDADADAARIARTALAESAAVAGCTVAENAPLRLRGKSVKNGWEFVFFSGGVCRWRESYILPERKK